MYKYIKNLISRICPTEKLDNIACSLSESVNELKECMDNSDLVQLKRQFRKEKNLRNAVLDHLDDMIWAKDLEGKYIMTNKSFRERFCYGLRDDEILGKDDIELATLFKSKVGNENHTFGEVCGNSDLEIHNNQMAMKFLESGNIDGKIMKLIVNKSPLCDHKGNMFAVCGSGRDVTEWHNDLEKAIEASNCCLGAEGRELLLKELNKLEFKNHDKGVCL
mgnify:CR=1 FL=1